MKPIRLACKNAGMKRTSAAIALLLVCVSGGCVRYEYDILEPPDLRQHVGENSDIVFSRTPLVYRLRSYESHLVMQIQNPTTQPIEVLGGRSYIVDPAGQSHPLQMVTIAPQAYIKLILPPIPPEPPVPTGPSVGFGFIVSADETPRPGSPQSREWIRPRYAMAVISDDYWIWEGETNVRVSFTFRQGDQPPFTHEFVFHRRKM